MRLITSGERARQTARHANYYLRVEVKDSENNWRDLTSQSGIDWVDGCTWQMSIDALTMTGSVTLKRESRAFSLAPLLTGSALNKDSHGAYAPLLDVGRGIRISTATTSAAVAPLTGDWKEVFLGSITDIDFGGDPITLTISDLGQHLIDTVIEVDGTVYGDVAGAAIESVMQQILDDNLGAGIVTLFVPVSPGWYVTPYPQSRTNVMDALSQLALQFGWNLRYKYDSSDVYRLTLYDPNRAKTTADATIGPDEYLNVSRLALSNANVRNVVKINYQDSITGIVGSQTASDSGSIAEFGRRYMEIGEGSSSNIDTATEALAMATAAVSDLADPQADQQIDQFYFWQVEVGDLLTYQANGVHYDADQKWAVQSYTHSFSASQHSTSIAVRGQVAGSYKQWLLTRNGAFTGTISTGPAPDIFPLLGEVAAYNDTTRDGMAWAQVRFDAQTAVIEIYALESATTPTPIPELSATRLAYSLQRQEGDKWSLDTAEYIVPIATRATYYRKTVSIGIGKVDAARGPSVISEVQAVDSGTGPSAPPTSFVLASAGTVNRITWTNGDATANTIVFRNGIGLILPAGTTAFIDTGISASGSYTYAICHWKNGQSSARIPDSGGGSGGGGGGGTAPPPDTNPSAPAWASGYPSVSGSNGAAFSWTSDPATTEVAIELKTYLIANIWDELVRFTDAPHVPSGSYTDTTYAAGTKLLARIRALVGGNHYYSAEVNATWGVPPLVAPKFDNGTPYFDGSSTDFSWTTASTGATSLDIVLNGVTIYHTTVSGQIQAGTYNHGASTDGGKNVYIRANYPTGSQSSATVRINTHTGGL